ncbi:SPFH domain-containing protein [Bifidobacterium pullorum]|uniref:SPFH domain-containing protein n=1 Tax=Bifidobacterium pullorum TaxID=78448 RepID=UPI0024323AE1|nr:SPFH domain-containing protein [Bifidobacterium pullorum]
MAIFKAFSGSISGAFADLWKEIITASPFHEHTAVSPGVLKHVNNERGVNENGSEGIISNGSHIYVPENTAAFIFSESGIENVIIEPGGYEYRNGEESILAGDGIGSLFKQIGDRFTFGGQPVETKHVSFINLREIRGIKFGTRAPVAYHDRFYGTDLEIRSRGTMSLKVTDPVRFVRNFVPANVTTYSFDQPGAREQILSEFVQSFIVAINSLSDEYRIAQLPAQANSIADRIRNDQANAGTWEQRFGFRVVGVGIESIEFTEQSRLLVQQYASAKMNISAYEGISQQAGNIAAQQHIARGIEQHGLGDGGGMLFGMNLAQAMDPLTAAAAGHQPTVAADATVTTDLPTQEPDPQMNIEQQIDAVKKLKELLDIGVLTQQEFDAKKKDILGL